MPTLGKLVETRWLLAALCCAASLCGGCGGSSSGRVTGKVTRAAGGAPLVAATIIARCDETGATSRGTTDAAGAYELSTIAPGDGTPPGTYKVVVLEAQGSFDAPAKPTIAAKYGRAEESGLEFTLGAGEAKTFDIAVDGL
jgi:hypothetical protein